MNSAIPFWLALTVMATVFSVMFSLGLMLGHEQFDAARRRWGVLARVLLAVFVLVPFIATVAVKLLGIKGVVAAGIMLMAISPGAPVAMRRAIDAGGHPAFAPALHLVIITLAVVSVPATVAILDLVFEADFSVSPFQVARQVFFAQLLPLALGAALRAFRPLVAKRIESRIARVANGMLVVLVVALTVVLWPLLEVIGWLPFSAGVGLTVCALVLGAACAGRDAAVRPAGAVAAAMRNPGLALVIATVNKVPATVTAAIFAYALGVVLVVTVFVVWQSRRQAGKP